MFMIKLFEEFRWMRRRNSKHKDVDPYNEEYWENDDDIYCDYCHGLISPPNKDDPNDWPYLFIIDGKPIHSSMCVWRWANNHHVSLVNVPVISYKKARKILKKDK